MATTETTIKVEPSEVEGFAEHLEVQLGCAGDGFDHADDRRAYLEYLRELLDIDDCLKSADPTKGVVLPRSATVERLIREGAESAPSRFGEALQGRYVDQAATMRQAKGLMSLGARAGLYEGVMV